MLASFVAHVVLQGQSSIGKERRVHELELTALSVGDMGAASLAHQMRNGHLRG